MLLLELVRRFGLHALLSWYRQSNKNETKQSQVHQVRKSKSTKQHNPLDVVDAIDQNSRGLALKSLKNTRSTLSAACAGAHSARLQNGSVGSSWASVSSGWNVDVCNSASCLVVLVS